ncbi:hypothetical protein [Dysosmobacter sp.]|uniref:hypothetical protein n=1 Tax=Dysosmobacter sp. TaxID=2591382 RepID=UPI002A9A2956|nr:hypothetical protein [Dysosmobacter sp.]MDY5612363.1 hypothetical protein [Dysosmobacter sp.]
MGTSFDLQMRSSTYKMADGTEKTLTPEIIVQANDIYMKADDIEESESGRRKGTSTVPTPPSLVFVISYSLL